VKKRKLTESLVSLGCHRVSIDRRGAEGTEARKGDCRPPTMSLVTSYSESDFQQTWSRNL